MPEDNQTLFTKRTILVALGLMVLFILAMYWLDRPAWCKHGFGIWTGAWTRCTSQHLADPYTFSHVLHGVIFYWLLWPVAGKWPLHQRLVAGLALEIGWEVAENLPGTIDRYRQQTAALGYTGDSIVNSFVDVLSTIFGFVFASRFSWKASVAIYVVLELAMLYVARDNLTLNVLTFLFPMKAVEEWQVRGAATIWINW